MTYGSTESPAPSAIGIRAPDVSARNRTRVRLQTIASLYRGSGLFHGLAGGVSSFLAEDPAGYPRRTRNTRLVSVP